MLWLAAFPLSAHQHLLGLSTLPGYHYTIRILVEFLKQTQLRFRAGPLESSLCLASSETDGLECFTLLLPRGEGVHVTYQRVPFVFLNIDPA